MDNKNSNINGTKGGFKDEASVKLQSKNIGLILEREDDDEREALLLTRTGGLSRNLSKTHLKVQWNDSSGNQLAEVLEFQPSDVSDSEEEDSDKCFCAIM